MGHIFKVLDNSNYINEKEKCLLLVEKMFENDNNKLANIADFKKHFDFIFSATYGNKAFLILFIIDGKLESMVNFYEYNSLEHDWCIFNLFTEKENRQKGYGEKTLQYALKELKKYEYNNLISGIEKDNIASIKLHEKNGFIYANCKWDEFADGFPEKHLCYIYNKENIMNKNTIKLETERLILRKIEMSDYEAIYNCWTSDENVTKYVTWNAHKSPEETKKLTKYWVEDYTNDYCYRWLVTLKETNEIIGMIDVISKNIQYMTAEVGYCYGSKYWGKGYASEALRKVIEYLHEEGFPVVTAEHFVSNKASGRVMEKAGMVYETTLKSRVINKMGEREDVLVYVSICE